MINLLREIYFFYNEIAVYLLFGMGVAGLLYLFFPENLIRRHLGGNGFLSVIKATAIGIPLPLCSCGVVPVAASLKRSGAGNGATIAFLTATPQIGADSYFITWSLLGPVFALFRIIAALLTALLTGFAVALFERRSPVANPFTGYAPGDESFAARLKNLPHHILFGILGPIANTLILGILIAGLISAFVPVWIIENYLHEPLLAMGVMLVVGIPMYVCASASTPIAAALIFKGLSPGAALVFLLTGPATNAVTIATVARTMGRRTVFLYLAGIAAVSVGMGLLLDLFFPNLGLTVQTGRHSMLPGWLTGTGAIVLTLLLAFYYLKTLIIDRKHLKQRINNMAERKEIAVRGMTCAHCAETVKKTVASFEGTADIYVDLAGKKVQFIMDKPDRIEAVKTAIRNAGYETD